MPNSEFSRMLSAEEVAALGPLPDIDAEAPTTSLAGEGESTASVHFAGIEPATKSEADDELPDPAPIAKGN
jgi:hypothetical protein